MATPSSAQIITDDNYVSTLDVHKPEIGDEYIERYVDELLLLDFMEMLGQSKPVRQTSYSHYEAPALLSYITVNANVADPGPGNALVVTLKASDHLNSGKASFPRKNDIVHFPNYVTGIITDKNVGVDSAHVLTIYPLLGTETTGAVVADQSIAVVSNAHPGNTDTPDGRTWSAIKYTNKCQIIKEGFDVEGSEMTNQVWIEVKDDSGNTGYLWHYEGERNTYRMLRVQMEMNLIITPQITNAALTALGYRTSEGMIPFVEQRGGVTELYNQGQMSLARHRSILKRLDKKGTYASEYSYIQGIDLNEEYENFISDVMKNGAINYGGFNGKKDMAIALGFNSIYTLGYTFHLKRYRMFNNENCLGAPGMNYPGMGICMPMGTTVHPRTGGRVPYFRWRPKEAAGYNRGMEHFYTGGAGNIRKTEGMDRLKMHYRSEGSVEFFVPTQWVVVKRA